MAAIPGSCPDRTVPSPGRQQFPSYVTSGTYPATRGTAGRVFVKSGTKVAAKRWYRAACSRIGSRVTVSVTPYGGTATTLSRSATGSSGALGFKSSVPASVGGKLTSTGAVVSSANDQFNGPVGSAWVSRAS